MEEIKIKRKEKAEEHENNNTDERLKIRESVQKRRLDKLRKSL